MEQDKKNLLEMLDRPAFVVQDGLITDANQAAKNRQIYIGEKVYKLLAEHIDAYLDYKGGVLHLTMEIGHARCGAIIVRQTEGDIFLMDRDADQAPLQALALASQQLRGPLSNILTVSDMLFPELTDPGQQEKAAQLRRSYFQMLRILCNMSDAEHYIDLDTTGFENTELCSFFREVVDQAKCSLEEVSVTLQYHCPDKPIFSLIHRDSMRRAVYNLVSNAIKFSPPGCSVEVTLSRTPRMAIVTVEDHGEGIADHVRTSLFHRYLREPAIEDTRFGLGLGMTLVRSVASAHSGTVLLEENGGTRVTMTMFIRKETPGLLHSPRLNMGIYTGGYDIGLLEFSEGLPASAYDNTIALLPR